MAADTCKAEVGLSKRKEAANKEDLESLRKDISDK